MPYDHHVHIHAHARACAGTHLYSSSGKRCLLARALTAPAASRPDVYGLRDQLEPTNPYEPSDVSTGYHCYVRGDDDTTTLTHQYEAIVDMIEDTDPGEEGSAVSLDTRVREGSRLHKYVSTVAQAAKMDVICPGTDWKFGPGPGTLTGAVEDER